MAKNPLTVGDLFEFAANGVAAQKAVDDICANRHRGNQESVEANPSKKDKHSSRARVVAHLMLTGGATCDEVAIALKTTPNAVSGRFTELKRAGVIVKVGRRETRSGSYAGVYAIKE